MSEELWRCIDDYLAERFAPTDTALAAALEASSAAGLPSIQISATQGKFLMLLAQAIGARRILEIGTLGAYSTIWLARALPEGGRLVTLECEPRHAEVARRNLAGAGLGNLVELRLGEARDTLPQLESQPPFDFIFIDADKPSYPDYLTASLRLARPGTLIVADNVVREGGLIDAESRDANVLGVRRFLDLLAAEPRVRATVLQTVGSKRHDGFALAVVR